MHCLILNTWQPALQQNQLHFCTEQIMAVLCSHMCSCITLTVLRNDFLAFFLANSMPHKVKCRTEAVRHLSPSLETWKMLKNRFIAKTYKLTESVIQLCFNMNLAMFGLPSNMKNSSHKTWQTSLSFLKTLQMQNLNRKKWGDMTYYVPPSETLEVHVPRVPHQLAPMGYCSVVPSPTDWTHQICLLCMSVL